VVQYSLTVNRMVWCAGPFVLEERALEGPGRIYSFDKAGFIVALDPRELVS
jgi:hypothetical protein